MPRHVAKHHTRVARHERPVAHRKLRPRKSVRAKKPVTPQQPVAAAAEPRVVGLLEIELFGSPEIPVEFEEEPAFAFPLSEDSFVLEEES